MEFGWCFGSAAQHSHGCTAILPLLESGEGPDWDANIMPPATRIAGIATHLMLGLRGFPPHK